MSQNFKENFFRDEEQQLDYDDSAFYYFCISILTVILLPFTYSVIKDMIFGEKKLELKGKNCECSKCLETLRQRQQVYKKSWIRTGFFVKIFLVIALWYLWYLTSVQISSITPLKSFDPYQILGLEPGAETSAIKKAYRKLSLLKHPDKNPDDPLAVTEFIQITKAYTTLTDEVARTNWEKYGNPDGPGNFHVAIALPRFLLQKENQVTVLVCFFAVLLVIVPFFAYNYLDQSSIEQGGVQVENKRVYYQFLNENLIMKNCPAILASSLEFLSQKISNQEQAKILQKIKNNDEIREKELIPKVTNTRIKLLDMKSLCIILAYLMRLDEAKHKTFEKDLEFILGKAPYLINLMIETAIECAIQFKMRMQPKRITVKNVLTLLEFSQNMVQGMWKEDDAFLQIPHMNEDKIKKLKRKRKVNNIEEFCKISPQERMDLEIFNSKNEFEDCEKAIQVFPLIDLKVEFYVDGEKDIAVGDFLTYKFTITQLNLNEKEQSGFVHSNEFPYLKQSQWYLFFTDLEENDFFRMEKITLKQKVEIVEQKQRVMQPGKMIFKVILKNDSYKGFDKQEKVEVTILKEAQRKEVEYDDEDVRAMKTPNMMQSMMDPNMEDSDDDEEDDEPKQSTTTGSPNGKQEQQTQESKKDK